MTRGISDPAPQVEQEQFPQGDLPTIAEMDAGIRQLYEINAQLQAELNALKDIMGASIAAGRRFDANEKGSQLTGL